MKKEVERGLNSVEDRYIWLPLQHKFSLLHKKGKVEKLVTPVFRHDISWSACLSVCLTSANEKIGDTHTHGMRERERKRDKQTDRQKESVCVCERDRDRERQR
jgi:hypothetical protein